jgi:hypothetical protein
MMIASGILNLILAGLYLYLARKEYRLVWLFLAIVCTALGILNFFNSAN